MGIEFEVKFQATEEAQTIIRSQIPGDEKIYQMQTTYYDTPDGKLSAKYYTLRCRMENETAVCTLKAPVEERGRGEWGDFLCG